MSTSGPEPPLRLVRRYSRFVEAMRLMLPMLALALVALVALWPQFMGGASGLIIPRLLSTELGDVDSMRMLRPRYVGESGNDEPYVVTAARAELDPAKPERIRLDELAAEIMSSSRRDVYLNARQGVYNRSSENLDLAGDIELLTSDGYQFATERARVNFKRGWVRGKTAIEGRGPAGTLSADRFEIREGGDVLHFEGRVRATIQPRSEHGTSS